MLQLLAHALALLATRRWWLVDERPTALMATDTLVEVEPLLGNFYPWWEVQRPPDLHTRVAPALFD